MSTLLLVDGSSYLYRAFHALPDLRNRAGEPTGALYGIIGMLRRLDADYKAEYHAVVFDAKGKTFRNDWYSDYKANRPAMPDDLIAQLGPIHKAVKAFGWPLLSIEGVEADDVIGALTQSAVDSKLDVVISTGDKDMAQLVGPRVTLVNTMTNEVLDEAGVEAKFGVLPDRFIDYLTLVGDSSDNVPGVAKVGPKTALKWLSQYGSLDSVVQHAAEIKGVVGENLRQHLGFLPLGKKLVTILRELPEYNVPLPTALLRNPVDHAALRALFERFEFRTWLQEMTGDKAIVARQRSGADVRPSVSTAAPPLHAELSEAHRGAYQTLLTREDLQRWLDKLEAAHRAGRVVAIDTETDNLDPMRAHLTGISLAVAAGDAAYMPLCHDYPGAPPQIPLALALSQLQPWLEAEDRLKVGQNIKYDEHVFANHGIRLRGIHDDTLLAAYVLDAGRFAAGNFDMDTLAERHLGIKTIRYTDVCGKGAGQIAFSQVDIEQATLYAAEDADITLRLYEFMKARLNEAGCERLADVYRAIEMPVRGVLFQMERAGVLVDAARLAVQSHELGKRLLEVESEAYTLAGQPFNLGSPKQLAEVLFTRQGLPTKKKTPGGVPSTDESVLSELALDYPLPKVILEARSLAKLKSTYTDKLPKMINPDTGRLHTNFAQAVAVTGRLASSDPNLQNIPVRTPEGRRIRTAFVAAPGKWLVSADYSQIELRIMAHLSDDPGLTAAFRQGEDVHRATAAEIFAMTPLEVGPEQRRVAKVINFGLIYGMSAFGLARELGLPRQNAQAYIDRYFARYPGVADYMNATRERARREGFVETVFGRRLWLPDIHAGQAGRRQGAERAAINAPMQGTAADLIKLAMIAVFNWIKRERLATRLLLQVHDELILEVPDTELQQVRETLADLMTTVAQLKVPLLVDVGVGSNWDEAH